MSLGFEWDREKAEANLRKHGISFAEAMSVFGDPLSLTIPDPLHSFGETRFVIVGRSWTGRILVVIHTLRWENIRIVSARAATGRERRQYEEGQN